MGEFLAVLVIVVVLALFFAAFKCTRREKELVAFYKAIHVCGRWYNFIMMDILLAGALYAVRCPVVLIMMFIKNATEKQMGWGQLIFVSTIAIVFSAAIIGLGLLMYRHALKKVPDELKKGFFKDALIMFLGTNFKLAFIFIILLFKIQAWHSRPVAYTVNGKVCYSYGESGDDLYDEHGFKVGRKSGSDEAIMTDSRYKK